MLKANNIAKRFGDRLILDGVSFIVNRGECAGIVAPNGAGKTTLLEILAGALPPDAGSAEVTGGSRIGYLRQGFAHAAGESVRDVFPAPFRALDAGADVERTAAALASATDPARIAAAQIAYDDAVERASSATPSLADDWRTLDLRHIDPGESVGALSGGEQAKLSLLDAFAGRPDVLLLDEPTNNLDLRASAWLDDRLTAFVGPVLIVSHDRALLDAHAAMIVELDPRTARAQVFAGSYTDYAAEKARRRDAQWAEYRRQQDRERRVQREIRDIKQTASRREHLSQNDFYRRKSKKVARRAVVLERRLQRDLGANHRVEKPVMREYRIKPEIAPVSRGGDRMLAAECLCLEAGGRVLLRDASLAVGWGERIVLVGPNGAGKTTLLRALAGETDPAGGGVSRSPSTKIGYLPQEQPLDPDIAGETPLTLLRRQTALSETEARRFLHRFLFSGDDVHTKLSSLSYGERRRLSLAALVLGGANLLLLDEPTNHLDIPSREALEAALEAYDGAMLSITHDRYFIERFSDSIMSLEGGVLREL
jgi:ATP-binding cassette subfamily F protein 3